MHSAISFSMPKLTPIIWALVMDPVSFNLLICGKMSCSVSFLEMLQTLRYMLPPNQYSLKILMKYYRFIWLKDKTALRWCKYQWYYYPFLYIWCLVWFGLLKIPLIIWCAMVTVLILWNVSQPMWARILHQISVIHQLTQLAGLILVKLSWPQWLGKNNHHHHVITLHSF